MCLDYRNGIWTNRSHHVSVNILGQMHECSAHRECLWDANQTYKTAQMKKHMIEENTIQPPTDNVEAMFPAFTEIVCSYLNDGDLRWFNGRINSTDHKPPDWDRIHWQYNPAQGLQLVDPDAD